MREDGASTLFGDADDCAFHYLYAPAFSPNLVSTDQPRMLNPAILNKFEPDNSRWIILSLGGNEHNVLSILQLYEKYDFILAERQDLPLTPGAEIYPEAMARETLRDWMGETLELLWAFRTGGNALMAQVAPPPPLPKAHILANPGDFLPDPAQRQKISPDVLRFKMWRLACGLYRETCRQAGIVFVETPSDMIDSNGMLAEPYLGEDATHANEAFGRRMMEEAFRFLREASER